jgi:ATP-binding cassette, subfamily B, bacterial
MSLSKKTLTIYWHHAWHYPKYVIGLLFAMPLTLLTQQFLPPLIAANVLDRLSRGDFTPNNLWGSFGSDLLLYAILSIFGGVVAWRVIIVLVWKLEAMVARDLYQRLFAHYTKLSADFHANSFGGSLVSQTNKFAASYVRIADTTLFQVYALFLALLFTSVILLPRAPLFVAFLLAFSAVYLISAILITRYVRKLNAAEASAQNKQTGYLADMLTNVLAVKSFATSEQENTRFAAATENTRAATMAVMRAATKRDIYFGAVTTSIEILSLVMAAASVVLFDADIVTVFLVLTYTSNIVRRLWEFSQNTLRNYNRAIGDARDATETLQLKPNVKDPVSPEPVRITRGSIDFQNVVFTHRDSNEAEPLFHKLNLRLKPGEKIGLVGHSGSGKTSLTKLILRFADIDSGEILVDGQNIAHLTQDDLRRHIAYVPQEPLLFHRTLSENIAYGRSNANPQEIKAIAKMAHAHEFIEKLPNGYETLVGERGVKLSGGQRQRIAIARAMLKNAPILLLDEATSALDSESERLIQDALWKLMEGRTAIVIAHRLSTIQKMDRIIVLDNGQIIEQGTHKELLRKNGKYAELWTHQSGGFLED